MGAQTTEHNHTDKAAKIKNFIIGTLRAVRDQHLTEFEAQHKSEDGELTTIKDVKILEDNTADFRITRTLANGHCCSGIPVFGMPMEEDLFEQISEFALENL